MTRKIKNLGLATIALAAMSMAAAASAQASELHATTQGSATITGSQTQQHVFTTAAGTATCTTANFEGTVQGQGSQITAQELTVTPTYSGCNAFGLNATVQMNGCKYTITNKNAAGATTAKRAYVDIAGCTAGKQIVVNAGFGACVATIPPQPVSGHLVFIDKGSQGPTEHVEIEFTLSGITYELHDPFCPAGVTLTKLTHDGTLHGKATFGAYVDTGTQVATKHGHQYTEHRDNGVQVGLRST